MEYVVRIYEISEDWESEDYDEYFISPKDIKKLGKYLTKLENSCDEGEEE